MDNVDITLLSGGGLLTAVLALLFFLKGKKKKYTPGVTDQVTHLIEKEVLGVINQHKDMAEYIDTTLTPEQLLEALKTFHKVVAAITSITPNQIDDKLAKTMGVFIQVLEQNSKVLNLVTKLVNIILSKIKITS